MEIFSILQISILSILLLFIIFISSFLIKIFSGKSLGDPNYPPVKGTLFDLVFHIKTLFDHQVKLAKHCPTYRVLVPNQSEVYTTDPRNIEHILKTKFDKYDKGDYTRGNLSDLFGQGIFVEDGEKWKQQRKLASFEFSTRVLRHFSCAAFRTNAIKLVQIVNELSKAKEVFDIHDMLMKYALDSIFKVGFGVELNCLDGSSKDGTKFMKAFDDANELVCWRYFDPTWKLKRVLNIGCEAALKRNIQIMDDFVFRLINQKRQILTEQPYSMMKEDILSRFIEASKKDPEQMNDKYLKDIILNFMIAGKDTTANTLSWFLYKLCKNPIVQEKLVQEVKEVLFGNSACELDNATTSTKLDVKAFMELLTDETLEKMHYLHATLNETLRLYPAVPVDGRSAMEDDILPDGYKVKKGDDVYYISYAMGRMQRLWGDDAEDFRPERWLLNGVFQPESPFKFIAFHAGPRICLGRDFAYRQMKIVSVALLYLFRFKLADERKPVTYRTMLTLHVNDGLHVIALPRIAPDALNFLSTSCIYVMSLSQG